MTESQKKRAVGLYFAVLAVLALVFIIVGYLIGKTVTDPDDINGWFTDEGGTKYYDRGFPRYQWQEIDGKAYYFSYNRDGYMVTGETVLAGVICYFGEDGAAREGWYRKGEDLLYLQKAVPVTGWQEIEGEQYYFYQETGKMATGETRIGGVLYHFADDGRLILGE